MNKEAKRVYDRKYHANRSQEKKLHKQKLQYIRLHNNILELRKYKTEKGCKSCGENDPIVLEFDHVDPSIKSFNIGDAIRRGYNMKRIMTEVSKCDVLCANCHKRRTAKQGKWRL